MTEGGTETDRQTYRWMAERPRLQQQTGRHPDNSCLRQGKWILCVMSPRQPQKPSLFTRSGIHDPPERSVVVFFEGGGSLLHKCIHSLTLCGEALMEQVLIEMRSSLKQSDVDSVVLPASLFPGAHLLSYPPSPLQQELFQPS